MPNINNLLQTQSYYTLAESLAVDTPLTITEGNASLTITPNVVTLTKIGTKTPEEKTKPASDVVVTVFQKDTTSAAPQAKKKNIDCVRIIDVTNSLFPKSEAVVITTPAGYKELQRLGVTRNND